VKTVRPALAAIAATCLIGLGSSAARGDPGLELGWDVVSRRPHDATAFTQGLELDASGRMFESTGLRGRSTLREVDPWSGEVLRVVALPDEYFGEGLTLLGDRLVQLTWRAGVAESRDVASLQVVETYTYDGEGWGLCFDGERLVMSDGSDQLTFRDPATFEITGSIEVTLEGAPQGRLNELECAGGVVWANIWRTDDIVRIDPDDGRITGVLDLAEVLVPSPALSDPTAVLNGIAYDAEADTFLVTGKLWPELIEIKVQGPLPSG
jgi:glutaminyl-peptide cyclotransferase